MPTSPEVQTLTHLLGGQYRVEEEIGRGGMGVVVRARDLRLDRAVAIKTLPWHLAGDAVIRERFLREARTAASLSHPNIVPIHHADEVRDVVFFVMGLVEGLSVAQRVRSTGLFEPVETIAILSDVAAALGYAHACGVIHRDVKAENILLDARNARAMVTDFGIARLAEAAPITATGTILGTVHYMSPEQVSGHVIDGRSDLYSLGVLAFHMLSGRFPFEHDAPSAVLVAHVMSHAPPLHSVAPHVPAALAAVVDRLLTRDPAGRYETAAHVTVALRDALSQVGATAIAAQPLLSSTEANQVWERAALLQQMTGQQVPPPIVRPRPASPASATSGYRLDDVRDAAEEAGISQRYVERALAERAGTLQDTGLVRPGPVMNEPVSKWMGSRTKLEYECVIDGELSEDELEEVVDEMRRSIGEFGTVGNVGRTVTFTSQYSVPSGSYPRKLQVSISSRSGRTTLRAYEDLRQFGQGVIWGVTGGVGGGVGGAAFGIIMAATKGAAFAVAPFAFIGVAAASFVGARWILRATVRSKEREIKATMERVSTRAKELLDARRPVLGTGNDRKKRLP